jgi:hypothetical protein
MATPGSNTTVPRGKSDRETVCGATEPAGLPALHRPAGVGVGVVIAVVTVVVR